MDNRDRRIDDRERVDFVVVALFFLPVLGALAIVSVKILEIALNRSIASSFDVLRTVVAIAGIGAATVVAGFLTLLLGTGDNGPGFSWILEGWFLVALAASEGMWILLICRRKLVPGIFAAASIVSVLLVAITSHH